MIKLLGWATLIGIGVYTGILQMLLVLIGMGIMWVGAVIGGVGGSI